MPDTDLLADLIGAKHRCLTQLREMGQRQLDLIVMDDMTALLDVLACKQRALAELQRIERALDPFRGQSPESRRWPNAQRRAACAEKLRQCESLLSEIVRQEEHSQGVLGRRRDEACVRLQGAHAAGQARGAYVSMPPQTVNQLDLSCER